MSSAPEHRPAERDQRQVDAEVEAVLLAARRQLEQIAARARAAATDTPHGRRDD